MENIFIELFNISLNVSYIIPAILFLRCLLKKSSKIIHFALWSIIGVRLILPLSYLPSFEFISPSALYEPYPTVDFGIEKINQLICPFFSETFASKPENSVNPLQIIIYIMTLLWISGVIIMCVFGIITHIKNKEKKHFLDYFLFILLSVYWFNPLIWVTYIFFNKDLKKAVI